MDNQKLLQLAKIELARRNFFAFCNIVDPIFYSEDRPYIVKLCNEFQDFYYNDDRIMIINMPPRHGKSRTAGLFVQWALGKSINNRIYLPIYMIMLKKYVESKIVNIDISVLN